MAGVAGRPHPPGDYDVVVVGSGPGGLQTSYFLGGLGVRHAVLSADAAPGGMFRKWPVFQRLLSWSKPDAPFPHDTREYEWYDHNSLVADEPRLRALVPREMDRSHAVPSRSEMEAGLAAFADEAGVHVRYGCRWEATRREDDGRIVLETSDGAYRCRAAVFAIGVTAPWKSPIPGIEDAAHYADTGEQASYAGKTIFVVGKRNSAFELANGLHPWARRLVLASPRPVETAVLAFANVSPRYLLPFEDSALGGGSFVLDAAIERIERRGSGFRVHVAGTTVPGRLELDVDLVIAATGFRAPVLDLPELGVTMVAHGRIPALTPFFESSSAPGIYFAGNASQGAPGLRKHGVGGSSAVVRGLRYNARVLAEHLAEVLGVSSRAPLPIARDQLAPFLAGELARAPELWTQKGYLARVVSLAGPHDEGIQPLEHFVDSAGPDAAAVAVEMDAAGRIYPAVYVRRNGKLRETALDPHQAYAFDGPAYTADLSHLLGTA